MHVDILIIGQGICGTMLSWFLHKAGKSFLITSIIKYSIMEKMNDLRDLLKRKPLKASVREPKFNLHRGKVE